MSQKRNITIREIKRSIFRHSILGAALMSISILVFICSLFKMCYFELEHDTFLLYNFRESVMSGIRQICQKTIILELIWEWAPILNTVELNKVDNYFLLFLTIVLFIGASIMRRAKDAYKRMKANMRRVEDLSIQDQLFKEAAD